MKKSTLLLVVGIVVLIASVLSCGLCHIDYTHSFLFTTIWGVVNGLAIGASTFTIIAGIVEFNTCN